MSQNCTGCTRVSGHNCVAMCKCGQCNLCHTGFICKNQKTWWSELGDPKPQEQFDLRQSHGGAGCPIISCSCKTCFKPRASKITNGKLQIYSHCGDTCRHKKCTH